MKLRPFLYVLPLLLASLTASADAVYAVNNPIMLPTAVSPPTTMTSTGDYTMTNNGLSTASLRITGTCTSLAGTVQGSNDGGTNWTDLTIYPVGGGSPTTSFAATGFWRFNAAGFNKVRAHVTANAASCTFAMAGTTASNYMAASDPCQDPLQVKSSAAINQGSSATTKVVDAVSGKAIYVCGISASAVGTSPTVTLISGTKVSTDCDTGPANLSGAINPAAAAGMMNLHSGGATVLATAASKQLCLTTAATTSIQGILTYVQK